jgi:hypothetical protein
MLMNRLTALCASVLVALLASSQPADAVDARAGLVRGEALGYIGCVQTFPSHDVLCFVALPNDDGTIALTATTGGFNKLDPNAGRIISATLPPGALVLHDDRAPRAIEFAADVPGIGAVDITMTFTRTTVDATNLGCQIYPVHFVLTTAADPSGFGAFMHTSGRVDDETISSLGNDCDAAILRPAYGAWSIDTV